MSSPLSVSSRIAKLRVDDAHLHHLGALLLAAGKADVDRPLEHLDVHAERGRLGARELDELGAGQLRLAARAPLRIEALAQELQVGHAGDFDRILEAEEQPRGGALVRLQGEQIRSPSNVTLTPRVTSYPGRPAST